ncbi:hypothetical protein ACW5R3_11130 [Bizionia sp. KMM 8389]
MRFNFREKHFQTLTYLFFGFSFIFIMLKPLQFANDSEGYLNISIIRSAPYPIFLAAIKFIFGSYFNIATVFFQACLGLFSCHYLLKTLKTYVKLQAVWYFLIGLILLIPYLYHHAVANKVLSEALAYPLYLLITAEFIKILKTKTIKNYGVLFPLLLLLLLTRKQFLFLVPIGLIVTTYLSFTTKRHKQLLPVALFFIVLPLIVSVIDRTYHKFQHQHFVETPWSGIHFITPAFYVADSSDVSLFETAESQSLFKETYSQLAQKQLNIHHLKPTDKKDMVLPYISKYAEIANHTVLPVGLEVTGPHLTEDIGYITVDKITRSMTLPLISNNFKPWLQLYIKNVINGFGNAKYMLIYLILLIYALISTYKNPTFKNELISFLLLLTCANICLVAIGMHTLKRFTFYNDWTLFLVIFILLSNFNTRNIKPHE